MGSDTENGQPISDYVLVFRYCYSIKRMCSKE